MTVTASLHGVAHRYGSTAALDGVDIDLGPGITGLLGPNGAGKTTLLRVVATVLVPQQGRVRLLGADASSAGERPGIRRQLGYLPQELGYPRGFTAFGFVDYLAVLKEWDDRAARHREVRRVLDLVGLGDVATTKVRRLSGGMRRRLGIAQALIGDPRLVVLDEPTTGLDPEQRASLRGVLSTLGASSTVLLSTHQTQDVEALCDRVIVMAGGRVQFDGTVSRLVESAQGHVWHSDAPDPAALASWRTGAGPFRHVGAAPAGAVLATPTLEDAYLLLQSAAKEAVR